MRDGLLDVVGRYRGVPPAVAGGEPARPGPGRTARFVLCLAAAASLLPGCADGERGDPGVSVRDSAGIEIVTSRVADGDSLVRLGEPVLEIGRVQGPEAYQLHEVRSAVRLSSGAVVVANGGTNQIRLYDSAGSHVHSTAGTGEGPGEFTGLRGVVRIPGDSLVAYSTFGSRISLFGPGARFVRNLEPPALESRYLTPRGGFPDGPLVVSGLLGELSSSALETGLNRPAELWTTVGRDGAVRDTLGRFPWTDGALYQYHGDGWGTQMILSFSGGTGFAFSGRRLFVGDTRRPRVRSLAADGSVERILRWDESPRALTEEFAAEFREWLVSGREDPLWRSRYREALERLPFPDSLPVFEALEATPAGGLWIRAFSPRHASEPERWRVFDPDGRHVGRVEMPPGFELSEVGEESLLGVHTDELGVERVRMYADPFTAAPR